MQPDMMAVVARYREDVSWTGRLGFPVVIYDKGGDWPGGVPLPNIGREAHTYVTHILRRYPEFPRHTLFLQGDPFPHLTPDGKAGVDTLLTKAADLLDRGASFGGLSWCRLRCDRLGRPHSMFDPAWKGKWRGWGKDIPVGEVFEKLFAGSSPRLFLANAATANFLVSRQRILTRPLGFYNNLLSLIENDPYDEMNTGHALERLWHLVFDGNKRLNRADYG
ncbi:DUF3431 domain-containing protein [Desulfovibrio aminophilus]|uniref:DUF3431 domain-containing protein n=1 Tax=Desulfovibrio aminophilus TaxID=81425 RepID=UPI00040008E5|nr:DUF3431 domain-containing protein [Desulfovibrio aminophilus]